MVRRTKEEAAATREHLLDTAEQVFLARGVSRTSLLEIAEAAGLSRGAIYWHFKDKVELFMAMMERMDLPCEGGPCDLAAQAHGGDVEQALRQAILLPLQRLCADERTRRLFTILIHRTEYSEEMASVQARHFQAIAGWTAGIAALLRSAQQERRMRADIDPDLMASSLFALIDGLLSQATLAPDPARLLAAGEQAVTICLAGLRPQRD